MKMYTAEEMREMALVEESYRWDVVAEMLRQAADMMDRAERVIAANDESMKYKHKDWESVLTTAKYILTGEMK